ncbi:MAG: GHKL domain-containing protein [Candidatus Heimdallarchaeota archaeon]|nr:GHKL domain-containing protein [Candidatus Heimdallarchaeota archaeon]
MVDQFTFTLNITLAIFAIIVTIIFWFTWRKRPDLLYLFIALIIFSISHIFLVFKQEIFIFVYVGNGIQIIALLVVIVSTFIEYYSLKFKSTDDKQIIKKEKIFLILTISLSILATIITMIFLQLFLVVDILVAIVLAMITLLIPITIFVLRIYLKQKTITRLFMFFVFLFGTITALSTILANYFDWANPLNYALNFIFISLIMTGGLAAPIEKRITDSEEKYRNLSEHLEEEINVRTAQLKEANKELETFSYSVSHDLKTPLRSIQGFSKAILQDYSEELDVEGKDFLKRIINNSERMGNLINDLLDLSNISRLNKFNIEIVDISLLANEIRKNLLLIHSEKNLEFHIQDNITTTCDPKLIRIVLENLFSNAIKFTSHKTNPKIEFGTLEQNEERVYYVKDNGVGFNMKYYDKLFGVFQRLHNNEEFEGTGIGLATVKRIIQKLNGEVWAEGEQDKGATFYFTINQE